MATMKKVVLKLDLHDGRRKQKAIKAVSTLHGIDEIVVDMKDDRMTVVGTVDPVDVVRKLRRHCFQTAQMVSVGPAKEEEAKKKDDAADKKDGGGGDKKDGDTKDANTPVPVYLPLPWYTPQWYPRPHHPHPCYSVHVADEDRNSCVIL